MTLSEHDAAGRAAAALRDHTYVDAAGAVHDRAWLTQEEADQASSRIYDLIGRRYRHYLCRTERCGGWHIRPCGMRVKDFARWSERHDLARSA